MGFRFIFLLRDSGNDLLILAAYLEPCYLNRDMKSQALLIQAALLIVSVASIQVYGAVQEVCTTVQNDVKVQVVGCQARTVTLNVCAGTCLSEESKNSKTCWCCKPAGTRPVKVEILCQTGNGIYRQSKTVHEHVRCTCARCFEN